MKYSEAYQRTRDIDWFFQYQGRNIHVASNGGKLPEFVNDIHRLRKEQAEVSLLEDTGNAPVRVNDEYVDPRMIILRQNSPIKQDEEKMLSSKNDYLRSFVDMAKKGFYSYDRDLDDKYKYVLICSPVDPKNVENKIRFLDANEEIEFAEDHYESFYVKTRYLDEW